MVLSLRSTSVFALSFLALSACGGAPDPGAGASAEDSTGSDDEVGAELGTEQGDEMGDGDTDGEGEGDGDGDGDGDPQCDPSAPELIEQDYLAANESVAAVTLPACEQHVWWVSAAVGVETTVTITSESPVNVAISYPDEPSFVDAITNKTLFSPGELSFVSPRSGEFAVMLEPHNPGEDPQLTLDYDLEVACTDNCGFVTTRFPLVLVHGWTGFENIGPLGYFYNVRDDLESHGYPVATAVLDPYNSVDVRGEQLVDFVEATLATHRARKVNLIGHSQGGIDSRYVAAEAGGGLGGQVGGLITVATPHLGTPVTDIALGLLPGNSELVLAFLLDFLGATQGQQSDAMASMYTLSETYMQGEFNSTYVDDPRVKYWSWTGETCVGGIGCMDSLDPLLLLSYELIGGANDGLVPEESAKWGEFLGLIPADHIDEIGQILGVTSINYDHVAFFRENAQMLRDAEL